MKIAMTHTRYSYVGGVERYIYTLVDRLLDAGHEVHYFCHFWDKDADPRIRFHRIPNPFKQLRFMKVWSFDRWSEKQVARSQFDIVHGFTKTGVQDVYTDGSGCLLDYQEYSLKEGGTSPFVQRLRRMSPHQGVIEKIEKRRFSEGNFRRIVAMSDFAQEQICRRYGLSHDRVEVIYNGIDLRHFNMEKREQLRAPLRERLNYGPEDVVALLVGNDYRRKGVHTLIQAAARIRDRGGLPAGQKLQIAVVGKERQAREQELYHFARSLGVASHVRFFGPQREISDWHAMSDVHVLPTRFDIFGNVVLEALAMGVPTICSSQAGAAEVLTEGCGIVQQDPRDAEELERALFAICGDRETRARMAQAAPKVAEQYSWDRHFASMLELYEQVAQEKKSMAGA